MRYQRHVGLTDSNIVLWQYPDLFWKFLEEVSTQPNKTIVTTVISLVQGNIAAGLDFFYLSSRSRVRHHTILILDRLQFGLELCLRTDNRACASDFQPTTTSQGLNYLATVQFKLVRQIRLDELYLYTISTPIFFKLSILESKNRTALRDLILTASCAAVHLDAAQGNLRHFETECSTVVPGLRRLDIHTFPKARNQFYDAKTREDGIKNMTGQPKKRSRQK